MIRAKRTPNLRKRRLFSPPIPRLERGAQRSSAQSGYYVDFANTLRAPSTTIWGARLGYEPFDKNWKAFLDFRNLGDENYAATANTAFDLKGVDSPNFYPGDGYSVYGGVSLRL